MDKELKQIFPESEETHKRVDLLVKVWLKNGDEKCFLIHIEVQGYRDKHFPQRMFTYFYRLKDYFKVPIATLVILTDSNIKWRPNFYLEEFAGTRLKYEYPIFKLADYRDQDFPDMENPWSWVMKAAIPGLKSKWDDETLLKVKTSLYRDFREHGYDIDQTHLFLEFLKNYVRFESKEYFDKFGFEFNSIENVKNEPMGILELVREHQLQEAREEGVEEGIQKGVRKS